MIYLCSMVASLQYGEIEVYGIKFPYHIDAVKTTKGKFCFSVVVEYPGSDRPIIAESNAKTPAGVVKELNNSDSDVRRIIDVAIHTRLREGFPGNRK